MPGLDDLLAIQERDTALDRLAHGRASIPERAGLAERERERVTVDAALVAVRARHAEVLREERRLEDEAQALRGKAKAEEERLYSGTVTSPKELQAMQADMEQLQRHAAQVDDEQLEVMVQREALDGEIAALEAALSGVDAVASELRATVAEREASFDAEMAVERAAREELARGVPSDLVARYEGIRAAASSGIGVALLVGGTCQGCRLSLPAVEVDRIRHLPAGAIGECEHCGCLLALGSH